MPKRSHKSKRTLRSKDQARRALARSIRKFGDPDRDRSEKLMGLTGSNRAKA